MDPNLRKYYQWIQVLAYFLQREGWPFTDQEISQQEARNQVIIAAQTLGLDPRDKDFLPKLIEEINRILIEQSIPDTSQIDVFKIRELVDEYENYLNALHQRNTNRIYGRLDPHISSVRRAFIEELTSYFTKTRGFSKNPILARAIATDIENLVAIRLPPIARSQALTSNEYQSILNEVLNKINITKILRQTGIKNPKSVVERLTETISQKTLPFAQEISMTPRLPRQIPMEQTKGIPSYQEENRISNARNTVQASIILGFSRTTGVTFYNQEEAENLSQSIENTITANLLRLPPEEFKQKDYLKLLDRVWPSIQITLNKKGISLNRAQTMNFIDSFIKKTQSSALTIARYSPRLPGRVINKLEAETKGIALWPAVLQPKLVLAYLQKAFFAPVKSSLEIAANETSPKTNAIWEKMLKKGIFAEDIEESIANLIRAGAPPDHPIISRLEEELSAIRKIQKTDLASEIRLSGKERNCLEAAINELKKAGLPENHQTLNELRKILARTEDRSLRVEEWDEITSNLRKVGFSFPQGLRRVEERFRRDLPAVKLAKGYFNFSKLKGEPIFDSNIGYYLPATFPSLIKGPLQDFLNKLGLATHLYQKVNYAPGITLIRPYLSERIMLFITNNRFTSVSHLLTAIYRNTLVRFSQAFARTAIGQTLIKGIEKASLWLGKKLGIQIAITTAGAVGAGPTAGVSLIISIITNLILKIGKRILEKIWEQLRTIFYEPEKALATIGIGAILAFLPMPFAVIAVVPIFLGSIGLLSWGAASLSTAATGFATKIVNFFDVLLIGVTKDSVILFIIILLATSSLLTFFIVITTAGAFILPEIFPSRIPPGEPSPTISLYIDIVKTASPKTSFENSELPVNVNYSLTIIAKNKKLNNVEIVDRATVYRENDIPSISPKSWNIEEITNSETINYSLFFDDRFQDSIITNCATVTADVENGPAKETVTKCFTIIIGNPPDDCPAGWPVTSGYITQGPQTSRTFTCIGSHSGVEAIDISTGSIGNPVFATHQGVVSVNNNISPPYGKYVDITGICRVCDSQGNCHNVTFTSRYAHLNSISVSSGQKISRGTQIGTLGNTGTEAAHLHFEFRANVLRMQPPYIPVSVLNGCCSRTECGINW